MKKWLITSVAVASLALSSAAMARVDIGISVGVPGMIYSAPSYLPPPAVVYAPAPPVYVVPPVTYYPAPPVYYHSPPGYYRHQPPVYVESGVVYSTGRPHYYRGPRHRNWHGH